MQIPRIHHLLPLIISLMLADRASLAQSANGPDGTSSPRRRPFPASQFDSNGDGRISFDEFRPTGPAPLHPRMKQVFDSFDKDGRGTLSFEDSAKVVATVSSVHPKLMPEVDGALQPIPIEVNAKSKRAMIKATVNGVEGRFLLDTGTSDTILFADYAKRAKVDFVEVCTTIVAGNYGKKGDTISFSRVPDMEIAGTHFRNFHVVLRESDRKYEFGGDGRLDGVMGSNVLLKKPVTLDFRRQQMTFTANGPGPHDLAFDLIPNHRNTPAVHADVDGVKIKLMFDSGAAIGDTILVNEPYHAALRNLAGDSEAKTYNSRAVRVDGHLLVANKSCLLRPFEETVIGSFFFDSHLITVDLAAGKIWLKRND